jgi:molecular chaperone DnaJ
LRLVGEGEAGPSGGQHGDLFVVLIVKEHEQFERQGSNLYAAVPITFTQAALGAMLQVPTLTGTHELKIPSGTQTGTVFRVSGQGMPILGGRGRGDLFVAVTLVTPKNLTREQRKLLEELAEIEGDVLEDKGFMNKVRNIFG